MFCTGERPPQKDPSQHGFYSSCPHWLCLTPSAIPFRFALLVQETQQNGDIVFTVAQDETLVIYGAPRNPRLAAPLPPPSRALLEARLQHRDMHQESDPFHSTHRFN